MRDVMRLHMRRVAGPVAAPFGENRGKHRAHAGGVIRRGLPDLHRPSQIVVCGAP